MLFFRGQRHECPPQVFEGASLCRPPLPRPMTSFSFAFSQVSIFFISKTNGTIITSLQHVQHWVYSMVHKSRKQFGTRVGARGVHPP